MRERETYDITYIWKLIHGTKDRFTDIEDRLAGAKGEWGREGRFGINKCKLLYIEWISKKVLLYRTGNYLQYAGLSHNEKECVCVCIYYIHTHTHTQRNHFAVQQNLTRIL